MAQSGIPEVGPRLAIKAAAAAICLFTYASGQTHGTSSWDARLSAAPGVSSLPSWLTLSGLERLRLEMPVGTAYKPNQHDFYALSRFRLDLGVQLGPSARLFVETQDARVAGYDSAAATSSLRNPFDLRQLYFEYGVAEKSGFRARIGRQELSYAGNWLLAPSEWPTNGRVFDVALAALTLRGYQADFLAGSVVLADPERVDRHKPGEHVFGAYFTRTKTARVPRLEAFLLAKQQLGVAPELGSRGDAVTYVGGMRSLGVFWRRFDYHGLIVREWGRYGADHIDAWGGDAMLGFALSKNGWKPRLSVECTLASGDRNAKDGSRGTFDPLYGSFHSTLGTADRLGWRNSRNLRAGVDFAPAKKWKVTLDARDMALLTVQDGLYNASGTREFLNTKAPSRHVGVEFDTFFTYQYLPTLSFGAGAAYLRPGAYLKASSPGAAYLYPYAVLTKRF